MCTKTKRKKMLLVIMMMCLLQGALVSYYSTSPSAHHQPPHLTNVLFQLDIDGRSPHKLSIRHVEAKQTTDNRTQSKTIRTPQNDSRHCSDAVCSSLLRPASLSCYEFCKEMVYSRTAVSFKDIPKRCKFRDSRGHKVVALVSVPGSGNTWVRGLLEKATGICTGSIYCDSYLRVKGFVGEYVHDSSVLVVKTHTSDYQWRGMKPEKRSIQDNCYDSAILLLRNPFDTFISERHRTILLKQSDQELLESQRLHGVGNVRENDKSHVHTVDKEVFFGNNSDWKEFVSNISIRWQKTIIKWSSSSSNHHSVLVVHYEDVKNDSLAQVERILDFLKQNYNRTELRIKVEDGFGGVQRQHRDEYEHYTRDQKISINEMIMKTIHTLQLHKLDHLFRIKEYKINIL